MKEVQEGRMDERYDKEKKKNRGLIYEIGYLRRNEPYADMKSGEGSSSDTLGII